MHSPVIPVQGQQQVMHVSQPPTGINQPIKEEYKATQILAVKWLSIFQLLMGVLVLVSQIITMIMANHFNENRQQNGGVYTSIALHTTDSAGTGIWIGIFIIISGAIGISSWRRNTKSLIVAHMIFNILMLIICPILIATTSISITELRFCRHGGIVYSVPFYRTSMTFYGETFSARNPYFHCSHHIFKAWLSLEGIMLTAAVLVFFMSLTLLIFNSKAACKVCCRSCCYSTQPTHTVLYQAAPGTIPAYQGAYPTAPAQHYMYAPTSVPLNDSNPHGLVYSALNPTSMPLQANMIGETSVTASAPGQPQASQNLDNKPPQYSEREGTN